MKLPTIAIVVPCYEPQDLFNAYLDNAISHASNLATFQTYFITGPMVERQPDDPMGKPNIIGSLRNKGIDMALKDGADYLLLTDDDNLLPSNFFEVMLMFDREPVKACPGVYQVANYEWHNKVPVRTLESYEDFGMRSRSNEGALHAVKGLAWFQYVDYGNSIMFIKAEVFSHLTKPYYEGINEDYGFMENLRKAGFKVWVAPLVAVEYR